VRLEQTASMIRPLWSRSQLEFWLGELDSISIVAATNPEAYSAAGISTHGDHHCAPTLLSVLACLMSFARVLMLLRCLVRAESQEWSAQAVLTGRRWVLRWEGSLLLTTMSNDSRIASNFTQYVLY
jgi:hypothetical protein